MPPANEELKPKMPGLPAGLISKDVPEKPEHFDSLYIMFYRHGMNANLTKGFFHLGDLMAARKRAEEHCKIMGYKYIFVRPMVCDLVGEEAYKLGVAREGEIIP